MNIEKTTCNYSPAEGILDIGRGNLPCTIKTDGSGNKTCFIIVNCAVDFAGRTVRLQTICFEYAESVGRWFVGLNPLYDNSLIVGDSIAVNPKNGLPLQPQPADIGGQLTEYQFWLEHVGNNIIIPSALDAIIRRLEWKN